MKSAITCRTVDQLKLLPLRKTRQRAVAHDAANVRLLRMSPRNERQRGYGEEYYDMAIGRHVCEATYFELGREI